MPASSSAPALTADAVDRLLAQQQERKHLLHETAREERVKEQQFRLSQRKRLTSTLQGERDQYRKQLGNAYHARRQRSAARLKESPLNANPLEDQERTERGRDGTEYHDEIVADRVFKSTMNLTFTKRVMIGDPFAELQAESRELMEQRQRLKAHMSAERTRLKMEGADSRRPNNTTEFFERRKAREDEAFMKEEFYRSLTGWDGRKLKARTKPVKDLWVEHKEAKALEAENARAKALQPLPAVAWSGGVPLDDADSEAPPPAPPPTTWKYGDVDDAGFVFVPEAGLGGKPTCAA